MSSQIMKDFEELVATRMLRFNYLLENSKYKFKVHQYEGVKWCIENELRPDPPANIRGGFIADEMGLGKTIMMIGTMLVNFLPRTLIVVPPILIHQWFDEIYNSSGHCAVLFYGDSRKKITQYDLNKARIVLTTYNMLLPESCLLKNVLWNRVIFDEAHHLCNSSTKRYRACNQLKTRVRWLVTGTPVQNKKKDFYNLCNVAGMKPTFYKNPDNLQVICKNFILRRTKQNIGINLPPVNNVECIVGWKTNAEMMLAEEIHSLLPNQTFVSQSKSKKLAESFQKSSSSIIVSLLRSRQCCVLPALMKPKIQTFSENGWIENTDYLKTLNCSSKLDAVVDLILQRKDNGKGKIIFCHFRIEIDVIFERLIKGGLKKVICYDGRNSGGHNLDMLVEPADALIIQIQSGCEGLNLQHNFSEIYFVSPHWNPYIEDQAIARCHRIGQTKPVDVFKFIMQGFSDGLKDDKLKSCSMESYIIEIQEKKREIGKRILDGEV